MSDVSLLVLVEKDKKKDIESVAEKLSEAGMKVDRKLSITGIISGTAAAEKVETLKKVEGVAELREEKVISLPPLDEKIPQ